MATERTIDTDIWYTAWFESLGPQAKLLYLYAFTNAHANAAGLYPITVRRIHQETGLRADQIKEALAALRPHVVYYDSQGLLWVRGMLEHQCRSTQFLKGAVTVLRRVKDPEIVREFLAYNSDTTRASSLANRYPQEWAVVRQLIANPCESIPQSIKAKALSHAQAEREGARGRERPHAPDAAETQRTIDRITRRETT